MEHSWQIGGINHYWITPVVVMSIFFLVLSGLVKPCGVERIQVSLGSLF